MGKNLSDELIVNDKAEIWHLIKEVERLTERVKILENWREQH